uniref:Uncharacterized protein n=1 Tax=Arundo donax TaxID=35708 RepID=A0A0A8ZBJ3_ARUDO
MVGELRRSPRFEMRAPISSEESSTLALTVAMSPPPCIPHHRLSLLAFNRYQQLGS